MKFKGTPGPWEIGYSKNVIGASDSLAIAPENTRNGEIIDFVCLVAPVDNITDEDLNNAQLIASAPELLTALSDTVEILGKLDDTNIREYYADLAIQYGDNLDVIQKALGANDPMPGVTPFRKGQTVLVAEAYDSGYFWALGIYCYYSTKRNRHIVSDFGYMERFVVPFHGNEHLHQQPVDIDSILERREYDTRI